MGQPGRVARLFPTIIVVVITIMILLSVTNASPFAIVGPGERGVKVRLGAVQADDVLGEGLHFKVPVIDDVKIMNVKIQKQEASAAAASADLQTVESTVVLNYHVSPEQAARLYQEVGTGYRTQIIDPALQESVKSSTAKFTAEELITKREAVREEIKVALKNKLEVRGLVIDDFNIINFDFSTAFNRAIELKVTAEQEALAAENQLERIKFEAQQKIEASKGLAEAIRIEAEALESNSEILELRALEKWDGVLPQVMSGDVVPFVNVR